MVPPVERAELEKALAKVGANKSTIIGSFIWITDTLERGHVIVDSVKKYERSEIPWDVNT